jgi:uncharacterized protein YgiM (DUF1202 family)
MKKLTVFLILGLMAAGVVSAQISAGGTLYVAVKSLNLKSSTGFFATGRGTLNYGDRVTVLQVNDKYLEVRSAANSSISGWTPMASLSARQIVSGSSSTASASEIALAGKGFNQEIEDAYKRQGRLNYADVDKVEAITVREADIKRFLEEGRLMMGEK